MNDWILTTTNARAEGIFSELFCDSALFAVTLEHAYAQPDGTWLPKLPRGQTYTCVRGMHTLEHWNKGHPFEAFEVTGVPGHSGILLHVGNQNADSDGCILIAKTLITTSPQWVIQGSRVVFVKFMAQLDGIDEFNLTVT